VGGTDLNEGLSEPGESGQGAPHYQAWLYPEFALRGLPRLCWNISGSETRFKQLGHGADLRPESSPSLLKDWLFGRGKPRTTWRLSREVCALSIPNQPIALLSLKLPAQGASSCLGPRVSEAACVIIVPCQFKNG